MFMKAPPPASQLVGLGRLSHSQKEEEEEKEGEEEDEESQDKIIPVLPIRIPKSSINIYTYTCTSIIFDLFVKWIYK